MCKLNLHGQKQISILPRCREIIYMWDGNFILEVDVKELTESLSWPVY